MAKLFFLISFLIFSSFVIAQKNLSVEIQYPYIVGNDFMKDYQRGIFDVTIKYQFAAGKSLGYSAGINSMIIQDRYFEQLLDLSIKSYLWKPMFFLSYHTEKGNILPHIGIGFTRLAPKEKALDNGIFAVSWANMPMNGFNYQAGVSINISSRFYSTFQYDHSVLFLNNSIFGIDFTYNLISLKAGVGIRI